MQVFIRAAAVAVFTLSCAMAQSASAQPAAQCEFKKIGDVAVDMSHGAPRVQISGNGQTRWVVLETNNPFSRLRKSDLHALGGGSMRTLSNIPGKNARGHAVNIYQAHLKDILVGAAFRLDNWDVLELEDSTNGSDVAGVIGADILAGPDVEFDLAHNRITFFTEVNCEQANLAYWDGAIAQAALFAAPPTAYFRHLIHPTVSVNGQPLQAVVDTTAPVSKVDAAFAARVGLKDGDPGVNPVTGYSGPVSTAKFESFAIGGEKISNPTLTILKVVPDLPAGVKIGPGVDIPEMVLGIDFLRSHRVLVASGQHTMYVSYNGGPVFSKLASK